MTLLFILIIGLLWVIVRMLRRYFALYTDVDHIDCPDKFRDHAQKQAEIDSRKEKMKEINTVIYGRLVEMDKKLPPLGTETGEAEMMVKAFKQLIRSSLNLLRERDEY